VNKAQRLKFIYICVRLDKIEKSVTKWLRINKERKTLYSLCVIFKVAITYSNDLY